MMMESHEITTNIEAVLYTTGKYMALNEIAAASGLAEKAVESAIIKLKEKYAGTDGALEIQEHGGRYKLNIKKKYGFIASKLAGEAEFDGPTIKTLAVIAYKSPIIQSEIIGIRGNKAYEHISLLKEDGLITSERHGRSRLLKLSNKFFEYFDVAEKEVKENLKDMEGEVRKNVAWKMGTTPEHLERLENSLAETKDDDKTEENNASQTEEPSGEEESGIVAESSENSEETGENKREKHVYDDKGRVIGVLGD
tara:strand:+ start:1367 stop:2125 length:759 start_codon:yes stop_codon:yes gene_type:complete